MALAPEVESASVVTPAPEQDNGETTEQANNAYGGMDDDNDDEAETTNSDVIPAPVEDADTTEQSNSAYGDADDNNDDGDDGETEETEEIGSDYDLPSDNEPEQGGDVASDADTEPVQTTTTPAQDVTVTPATDSSVQTNGDDVDPVTCLAAHNKVRAAVGVPALTWDASLAAKGVSWAQHMEDLNFFDHNTPGQDDSQMNNLYSGTSCLDAVAAFESEKSMFPADHIVREENYIDYGHYSMMVWRTTTRVGCGRGATKNLVCYYEEPGNVVGEAAY
uniref:SCP domain-containing protein n=1 Tax=Globisporangium ultimum (strain ATCC 200006 / CBS 805.95 / DAOM BR144) TaxID=431595 RepID=K3WS52_GLOUD